MQFKYQTAGLTIKLTIIRNRKSANRIIDYLSSPGQNSLERPLVVHNLPVDLL
jgi:hypothetical protein